MSDDLISRAALLAAYDAAHEGPPGRARKLIEESPTVAIDPGYEIRNIGFNCITQNPVDEEDMRTQIRNEIAGALLVSDALVIKKAPYGPYHTIYKARMSVAVPRRHVDPKTCGPDYCELEAEDD